MPSFFENRRHRGSSTKEVYFSPGGSSVWQIPLQISGNARISCYFAMWRKLLRKMSDARGKVLEFSPLSPGILENFHWVHKIASWGENCFSKPNNYQKHAYFTQWKFSRILGFSGENSSTFPLTSEFFLKRSPLAVTDPSEVWVPWSLEHNSHTHASDLKFVFFFTFCTTSVTLLRRNRTRRGTDRVSGHDSPLSRSSRRPSVKVVSSLHPYNNWGLLLTNVAFTAHCQGQMGTFTENGRGNPLTLNA